MKTEVNVRMLARVLASAAVAVGSLFYFNFLHEKSVRNVIRRQYYEKIELISGLLEGLERLQMSCASDARDEMFNNFIISAVEQMDRQYGIYGRVIDLEGKQISEAYLAEDEPGLAVLLEADDYDFESDLYFVRDDPIGDRHIVSKNDVRIHLFWLRYPVTEQHYYYILLGVVYDRVVDTLDFNAFACGVILIALILLFNMLYTAFLENKVYRLKSEKNEVGIK